MNSLPIQVLFEDEHCLVVNKPSGLFSQAAKGVPNVEAILRRGLEARQMVRLVHRLDQGTSGTLLLAKTRKALSLLSQQFAARTVEKSYFAVCEILPQWNLAEWPLSSSNTYSSNTASSNTFSSNTFSSNTFSSNTFSSNTAAPIDADVSYTLVDWIAKIEGEPRGRITPPNEGRKAISNVRLCEHDADRCLWEVQLLTGRMHQIRIQLASRHCPVLGDRQYGSQADWQSRIRSDDGFPVSQFALHARYLQFRHPVTAKPIQVVAPFPDRWSEVFRSRNWRFPGNSPR